MCLRYISEIIVWLQERQSNENIPVWMFSGYGPWLAVLVLIVTRLMGISIHPPPHMHCAALWISLVRCLYVFVKTCPGYRNTTDTKLSLSLFCLWCRRTKGSDSFTTSLRLISLLFKNLKNKEDFLSKAIILPLKIFSSIFNNYSRCHIKLDTWQRKEVSKAAKQTCLNSKLTSFSIRL